LHAAGGAKVYDEKVSGAATDRKALGKVLAALQEGDTLVVTRLDRLAWSTRDLLNTPLPRRVLAFVFWQTLGPRPQRPMVG
jgi:DNA invertase Pin-like site-specific DNA recombinase